MHGRQRGDRQADTQAVYSLVVTYLDVYAALPANRRDFIKQSACLW
jgi:hypothetical protein